MLTECFTVEMVEYYCAVGSQNVKKKVVLILIVFQKN